MQNYTNSVKLISLDIVSLFIKVPVDKVLNFFEPTSLKQQNSIPTPRKVLPLLLGLCVEGTVHSLWKIRISFIEEFIFCSICM